MKLQDLTKEGSSSKIKKVMILSENQFRSLTDKLLTSKSEITNNSKIRNNAKK